MYFFSNNYGVLQYREGHWVSARGQIFQTNQTNILPVDTESYEFIYGEIKVIVRELNSSGNDVATAILTFMTDPGALGNGDPGIISREGNSIALAQGNMQAPESDPQWFQQLEEIIWYAINEGDTDGKVTWEPCFVEDKAENRLYSWQIWGTQ